MKKVDSEEYRTLVFENAKALINKKGIKGLSMVELAKNCGIAKQTLYTMVGNKENLLISIHMEDMEANFNSFKNRLESIDNSVESIKALSTVIPKRLAGFTRKFANELSELYPEIHQRIQKSHEKHNTQFRKYVDLWKEHGYIKEDIDSAFFILILKIIIERFLQSDLTEDQFINEASKALSYLFFGILDPENEGYEEQNYFD